MAGAVGHDRRYARTPVDLARLGARAAPEWARRTCFSLGQGERAYRVAAEPVEIFGKRVPRGGGIPVAPRRETMEAVATA
jgi:hypothetical protein